jgi:pimeloyl-ACP methyl ester carboxylesterase
MTGAMSRTGTDGSTLLLLHGLAGTRRVWDPVIEALGERWPGPIVASDLPGHGEATHDPPYSFGGMAAAVARSCGDEVSVVLGHSLGGVVGLALGSGWFGCRVGTVVAVSIKVAWTDEELAGAAAIAAKPPAWFDTRDEAVSRYLRVAGLTGLVDRSGPVAAAGVVEEGGRFRLAHDPATAAVGAPDMEGLLAACRADVVLGGGTDDQYVSPGQLLGLDPSAIVLDGIGHNPHLENPALVADLVPNVAV